MAMFMGVEMAWACDSTARAQARAAERVRVGMGRVGEEEGGMVGFVGGKEIR